MGTNYYMLNGRPPCKECGRAFEDERHIGKSSMGWVFSLRIYPDEGINTIGDWLTLLCAPGVKIRDEYGADVPLGDLLRTIAGRRGRDNKDTDFRPSWLRENQAVPGPHGLARDATATHGEGTWDYHVGEFS